MSFYADTINLSIISLPYIPHVLAVNKSDITWGRYFFRICHVQIATCYFQLTCNFLSQMQPYVPMCFNHQPLCFKLLSVWMHDLTQLSTMSSLRVPASHASSYKYADEHYHQCDETWDVIAINAFLSHNHMTNYKILLITC